MTDILFSNLVWIWIAIALILFPVLLKVTAPYGRHTKKNWGPMIDNRLGWFIMESPSLFLFLYFIFRWGDFKNLTVLIASIIWVTHYFHRTILFPLRIKTEGKKMPIVIMLFAVFFNLINVTVNGYWLSRLAPEFSSDYLGIIKLVLGIVLFISGFIINKYHDRILILLRRSSNNGYKIPYGGLFRYVSCPNFLGEIIAWSGFALLVWSLPALSFLIWTIVNLLPRALDHHKWYRQNFSDYPPKRKAIFPFIL